jgi:hypothetical protein
MIIAINEGQSIYSTRTLSDNNVQHWTYKHKSDRFDNSFPPGTAFKVVTVNKVPGVMWVKVLIPGSKPERFLIISGEEFSWNFSMHKQ